MKISTRIKSAYQAFRSGEYWQVLIDQANFNKVKSGVAVNDSTALTYSAVWAAMSLITETMSTVPLQVFQRTDKGREVLRDHSLYDILHDRANPIDTAQEFRAEFNWNLEMTGIGLAEKVRTVSSGRLKELWNINPDDLQEIRLDGDGRIRFIFRNGKDYGADKIFYCYGVGKKGLQHRSRLKVASEAIGLGLASEEYGARFFGQGTNLGGFLERPDNRGNLKKEVYDRLKESVNEKYAGLGNAHKLIILEDGMTYKRADMANDDAQFLETRKFQISDIARFFNVKSYMLGDLERATFSNIEAQGIENVTYSWRPRAIRIEQAMNQQLLSPAEQKTLYVEHNLNGLMQGDLKSQAEVWNSLMQAGILNANEIRSMMNMNEQEGEQGKIYYMPLNMTDKAKVNEEPAAVPTEPRFSNYSKMLRETPKVYMFRAVANAIMPAFKAQLNRFDEQEYTRHIDELLKYQEKRAEKGLNIEHEIVRMRNAFIYSAMQSSGIKKVQWKSREDCPHCRHLDGKTVDIGQKFEDNILHAPLKEGCNCDIGAYYEN